MRIINPFPEFASRISCGFTTRMGGLGYGKYSSLNLSFRCGDEAKIVHQNWDLLKNQTGLKDKELVMTILEHGDKLVEGLGQDLVADALYTQKSDRVLAVTMADCLAAIIYDPKRNTIAAVHAGWRGTCLEMVAKTLKSLTDQGFIKPQDTYIAFSQCLRPNYFEIGEDVAAQFQAKYIIRQNQKIFLDLPTQNFDQAIESGILPKNIRDTGGCTFSESEKYFSYRRDGQTSGRMAAFIALL